MSFGKTVTLNTGAAMPRIGYGTWQSKPGEVGDGVYEALKAGYRHLDLAKVYGNQKEVGQGIKRALADVPGLKREQIFITSKLWNSQHQPDQVEAALDDTLAELQLDYLDVRTFFFFANELHRFCNCLELCRLLRGPYWGLPAARYFS